MFSYIQVELSQIRAEIEKRLQEKEEEFENTRKAHQRVIEGMQASLDQETRAKAELLRIKKKLESDVNVSFIIGKFARHKKKSYVFERNTGIGIGFGACKSCQ